MKPIKPHHVGCVCCKGGGVSLSMDTVLYAGFGGWHVMRNDEMYYQGDYEANFSEFKRLNDIEAEAANDPDADWRAIAFMPLHGETYQRQNGQWVLVEQNEGFA